LLPGATLTLQIDEPTLPTVLAGQVRSESGYRVLPAPEASQAEHALGTILSAARDAGASTAVHCCGAHPPLGLLHGAGPEALALDITMLDGAAWDAVATAVEADTQWWAGLVASAQATTQQQ